MFSSKHLLWKDADCSMCGLFQGTIIQIASTEQTKTKETGIIF
jgi:hypothetical protein